jgi:FAD/FMN-containing dehydrogenase
MPNSTTNFDSLKPAFKGDIDGSDATLATYSHDASLFTLRPRVVVFPKDADDVKTLVKWVNANRASDPELSITARSAGTDMSGGSINHSIICDFTRYMNAIGEVNAETGTVQPGCFYRNFEKETLKYKAIMPTYPASREICAVGGMVSNNSGGEKSLKYGKTANHIKQLKVVFTDGNEYVVKPLTETELKAKIAQNDFEGEIYKKIWDLIQKNYDVIMAARPDVSKNSAGYYLWNVYDKKTGIFDLCQIIAGSQGTFGILTEITFKLVPVEPFSNMLVVFLPNLTHLSELINEVLPPGEDKSADSSPDSVESYDDYSMNLAVKFFFDFFKELGFWGAIKLGFQFIPDAWDVLVSGHIPKLILMVEYTGTSEKDIHDRLVALKTKITHFGYKIHIARSSAEADKYWRIRRESFNLLRKHTKGKKTAPFIDDIIVKPEYLPEFLPKVQALIDQYKLVYTIAGHPGNGNFHIIPLMDLNSPLSSDIILELSKKVYDLVHEYHGSITAEHNDGIIRTPYLLQMYGPEIISLFQQAKNVFDPSNILNPGKKVGGTFDDIRKAIK